MPYADPEKQKEAKRESYKRIYAASRKFRREEAERKAAWLQTEEGKESNKASTVRHRKKVKKAARKPKPRKPAAAKKGRSSLRSQKRGR